MLTFYAKLQMPVYAILLTNWPSLSPEMDQNSRPLPSKSSRITQSLNSSTEVSSQPTTSFGWLQNKHVCIKNARTEVENAYRRLLSVYFSVETTKQLHATSATHATKPTACPLCAAQSAAAAPARKRTRQHAAATITIHVAPQCWTRTSKQPARQW